MSDSRAEHVTLFGKKDLHGRVSEREVIVGSADAKGNSRTSSDGTASTGRSSSRETAEDGSCRHETRLTLTEKGVYALLDAMKKELRELRTENAVLRSALTEADRTRTFHRYHKGGKS